MRKETKEVTNVEEEEDEQQEEEQCTSSSDDENDRDFKLDEESDSESHHSRKRRAQDDQIKSHAWIKDVLRKIEPLRNIHFYEPLTVAPDNYQSKDLNLKDYQLLGLNWLRRNWYFKRNCILADEMGLGKTIQLIVFLQSLADDHNIKGPFLIIVPLSTLQNWERELQLWTSLKVNVVYKGENDAKLVKNALSNNSLNIVLTTYSTLIRKRGFFASIPWHVVVADEAHKLKTPGTKIRQSVEILSKGYFIMLTGTPFQVNIIDLYHLLVLCDSSVFNDKNQFLEKFGELKTEEQVLELRRLISPYVLRRTKQSALVNEIPPKEEIIVELELTNIQKTLYRAIVERKAEFLRREYRTHQSTTAIVDSMKKCCNHPFLFRGVENSLKEKEKNTPIEELMIKCSSKLIFLDKLINKVIDGGEKILIFCQMLDMLTILEDYLQYKRIEYVRLDGSTNKQQRIENIDRFSDDSLVKVFLLSTRAGGLGINLVSANHSVIFDSDFNPFNDVQASDRCHRIGQKKKVMIYRLITKNTYEMYILKKASTRLGIGEIILGSQAPTNEEQKEESELDRMLRYGVYHFFLNQNNSNEDLINENIDTILARSKILQPPEKNPAVISIFSGGEDVMPAKPNDSEKTAQEAGNQVTSLYFRPEENADLDINDDNFWEKIFPDYPDATTLESRLDNKTQFNANEIVHFMKQLRKLVQNVLYNGKPISDVNDSMEEILLDAIDTFEDNWADERKLHTRKTQLHNLLLKFMSSTKNLHFTKFSQEDRNFVQLILDKHFSTRVLRSKKIMKREQELPPVQAPSTRFEEDENLSDSEEEFEMDEIDENFFDNKYIGGFNLKKNKKISEKYKATKVPLRLTSKRERTTSNEDKPVKKSKKDQNNFNHNISDEVHVQSAVNHIKNSKNMSNGLSIPSTLRDIQSFRSILNELGEQTRKKQQYEDMERVRNLLKQNPLQSIALLNSIDRLESANEKNQSLDDPRANQMQLQQLPHTDALNLPHKSAPISHQLTQTSNLAPSTSNAQNQTMISPVTYQFYDYQHPALQNNMRILNRNENGLNCPVQVPQMAQVQNGQSSTIQNLRSKQNTEATLIDNQPQTQYKEGTLSANQNQATLTLKQLFYQYRAETDVVKRGELLKNNASLCQYIMAMYRKQQQASNSSQPTTSRTPAECQSSSSQASDITQALRTPQVPHTAQTSYSRLPSVTVQPTNTLQRPNTMHRPDTLQSHNPIHLPNSIPPSTTIGSTGTTQASNSTLPPGSIQPSNTMQPPQTTQPQKMAKNKQPIEVIVIDD